LLQEQQKGLDETIDTLNKMRDSELAGAKSSKAYVDNLHKAKQSIEDQIEAARKLSEKLKDAFANPEKYLTADFKKAFEGMSRGIASLYDKVPDSIKNAIGKTGAWFAAIIPTAVKNAFKKVGSVALSVDPAKVSAGLGIVDAMKKGSKELLKTTAKIAGKMLGGPFGDMASQVIDVFAMSPDKFKELIIGAIKGIPQMISDIIVNILSMPAIIAEGVTAMINEIPRIVESFVYFVATEMSSPFFWNSIAFAFIKAMVRLMPNLAIAMIKGVRDSIRKLWSDFEGLGKKIFDGFTKVFKAAGNFFKKLFKFDGGGKGAVEKFLHFDFPFVKFAEGGKVPGIAPVPGNSLKNDIVPALLSPGEIVLPRTIVDGGMAQILPFLRKNGTGQDSRIGTETAKKGVEAFKRAGVKPEKHGLGSWVSDTWDDVKDAAKSAANAAKALAKATKDKAIAAATKLGIPVEVYEAAKSLIKLGANIDWKELAKNPTKIIEIATRGISSTLAPSFKKMMSITRMATGGEVPAGYENDTYPALLSSGENVTDKTLTRDLKQHVREDKKDTDDVTQALLAQVIELLSRPQTIETELKFNDDVFGNILVDLKRRNIRTA